jgi:hypothetical protein
MTIVPYWTGWEKKKDTKLGRTLFSYLLDVSVSHMYAPEQKHFPYHTLVVYLTGDKLSRSTTRNWITWYQRALGQESGDRDSSFSSTSYEALELRVDLAISAKCRHQIMLKIVCHFTANKTYVLHPKTLKSYFDRFLSCTLFYI